MKTDQELRADILPELEHGPRVRSAEIGLLIAVTLASAVVDNLAVGDR